MIVFVNLAQTIVKASPLSLFRQQASIDLIKSETPNANLRKLILDLSSLAAVRKAAAEVNTYTEPIHVRFLDMCFYYLRLKSYAGLD